jgi:ompA family protein
MANKIRVHGKAQNRTVLGIVNAYLVMHPKATLEELKAAFPDSLNPDSGVRINFVDMRNIKESQPENWNGFFTGDDELFHLADGTTVALVKMWTKPSFERMVAKAAEYGIEIASFTEADKGFGKKGGYRLEYLNGYVPPVDDKPKKKRTKWPWIVGALVAMGTTTAGTLKECSPKDDEQNIEVKFDTVTVVKKDTVYVKAVEEIEKNFNAAQFEVDDATLNDNAKFALHDLSKLMKSHENIKVDIVGHTSSEGDVKHNQQLSEARAKSAYDFLVSQGIAADRLKYEGKGSSEPVDPNKPELNRRTEFIVH